MEFQIEEFIEKIKCYPELYNKANKNYKDVKRKDKLWADISKEFNIEAKKKWNGIRDRYVREKKKQLQPSGSKFKTVQVWELLPMLQFLDDSIKPRTMTENSYFGEIDDSSTSFQLDELDSENTENPSASSTPLPPVQPPTKRRKISQTDEVENRFLDSLNNLNNKINFVEKEETEDSCFLKSIEFSMKKMSDFEKINYKILMLQKANEAINNSNV